MSTKIENYHGEDFIEIIGNDPINLVFKLKDGVEYRWITPSALLLSIDGNKSGERVSIPIPCADAQKSQ
ncbi:hypothetical protein BDD43_4092 [Mucilaginibacter gracilis]|uniref:Uncharacterized protein n=1 Tax=Mucilaginibacter gracilis TaxID=423350 RepID=A0A495J4J4_9SPHI|nr:hypothetical protein [Mucilaginibacter gracilis]RKR83877.1 hypothetical protein BDD43_4092 [Mucilaginibacter gracilis]